MSAQANGLGKGTQASQEAPTGRPYSARVGLVIAPFSRRGTRAAPLGLESDTGGRAPRAALRLPWADIGLPLRGERDCATSKRARQVRVGRFFPAGRRCP